MRLTRHCFGPAAAALALACGGCGEKPSVDSSTAQAKVTGKVTIKGKPMTAGSVRLDPTNYARPDIPPQSGEIKKDGTYEVSAYVGKNTVRVNGPAIDKFPELGYANQTVDVSSSGTTFNIELPPPK
jgi:hypothetical protein